MSIGGTASTSGAAAWDHDQNLLRMLWPADATDARMLFCVALVRLLLVPGATLLLVRSLAALRLLPDDPVCALVVLVQVSSSSPSTNCSYLVWLMGLISMGCII